MRISFGILILLSSLIGCSGNGINQEPSVPSLIITDTEKAKQAAKAQADAEKAKQAAKEKANAEKAKQAAKTKADAEKAKQADKAQAEAEKAKQADKAQADAEKTKQAAKAQADAEKAKQADKAQADAEKTKQAAKAPADAEKAKQADKAQADAEKAKQADKAQADAEKTKQAAKAKTDAEKAAQAAKTKADAEKVKQAAKAQADAEKNKRIDNDGQNLPKKITRRWNIQRPKNFIPTKVKQKKEAINRTSTGTGFFISENGYFLTNEHVVRESININVLIGSEMISAKIIELDNKNDIALLKIDKSTKPLVIEMINKPAIGAEIAVLGFPNIDIQGNNQKATFGYINSTSGIKGDKRYLQISSPIQPGNSGSPLLNSKGRVVGVVTSTLNQEVVFKATGSLAQNVNYALNIKHVIELLKRNNAFKNGSNVTKDIFQNKENLINSVRDSVILIVAQR